MTPTERNAVLEEAAQVAEKHPMRFAGLTEDVVRATLAAAIRALKEQEPTT